MRKRGRRWAGRRPTSFAWEMAFAAEVRQVPPGNRADLLAWLRRWRRHPQRIFWVMDGVGCWHRLA